jgi:hypothetical protein
MIRALHVPREGSMMGHGLRFPPAALLLLLLCFPLASIAPAGDPDVAKVLFEKGAKAFKARKYEEARDFYQRAVDEYSPCPEALFGLAQALEKLGLTEEATTIYARVREDVQALPAATRSQKKLAEDAAKAAARLGKEYAELAGIDQVFFRKLMDLGRKYMTSNPPWAKKFFTLVLLIEPDNPLAKNCLERLGDVDQPVIGGGKFEPLFTDPEMKNWVNGRQPSCQLRRGTLTIETPRSDCFNFARIRLNGRYAVRCSFRMLETPEQIGGYGLRFGKKSDPTGWGLIVQSDATISLVQMLPGSSHEQRLKNLTGFDLTAWHALEVQVDGPIVVCLLDGSEVFRLPAPSADLFDGTPGVFAGKSNVELREMGVSR